MTDTFLELEQVPPTMPLELSIDPATVCAWCGIKLSALVSDPKGRLFAGERYHPGGCVGAARLTATSSTEEHPAL